MTIDHTLFDTIMATTTSKDLSKRNGNNSHLYPGRPHRIVVHRDFSEGVGVRFNTAFPDELTGRIDPDAFYILVNKVNKYFVDAERISFYSVVDSILGCLTAYLIFLCVDTHYERCIKKVSRFIDVQNKNLWIPRGLYVTDPKDKGLRVIEITFIDEGGEGPIYIGDTTVERNTTQIDHDQSDHNQSSSVRAKLLESIEVQDDSVHSNGNTVPSEEYSLTVTPKTPTKTVEEQEEPLLSSEDNEEDRSSSSNSKKPYFETALE